LGEEIERGEVTRRRTLVPTAGSRTLVPSIGEISSLAL
jgi:hypothetical protein